MNRHLYILVLIFSLCLRVAAEPPPPAPIRSGMTDAETFATSAGCIDCHRGIDTTSMHRNPAVKIGCTECHGGDASVRAEGITNASAAYRSALRSAHVQPRFPDRWPTSANPEGPYNLTIKESAEFVKFVNPGDLRVASETCGGCHAKIVDAVRKNLMATSAMLWGGASYNNNILPYKRYVLGEGYSREGEPVSVTDSSKLTPELISRGALQKLFPLPVWEVTSPGDIFRVFERGGVSIKSQFPEIGIPKAKEDPGKPDIKASNRGPGTGNRISVPVINIHKTRLNDPHLALMGTNDHPGDYRSSGCTGCHAVYANDRDPRHSGPYSKFGHEGKSISRDPTISREQSGHPLTHEFTRAIPTSQCMVCHMHQPNMFVNSFLGYTMWDYESDAAAMWPKKQKHPTDAEKWTSLNHNPEEAATHGLWSDKEFLKKVSELNPKLQNTQFADYHGHGWNFRAIFKKDRKGNLLDKDDKRISWSDPKKFQKAVHMADIHVDKGMHCVDCHFQQDSHGDGHIYGEVAQQVEIQCQDCHGTVKERATLRTSGPAAPPGGTDLSITRSAFGQLRFQWRNGALYQRSNLTPGLEWRVKQVRDSVDPSSTEYNAKAARAKNVQLLSKDQTIPSFASLAEIDSAKSLKNLLAHNDEKMACFTCHSSWITSCGGCHLPIQANWKQENKHYELKETRNWASYNPQVVRDDVYQIGLHGPAKGNKIVPVRSSSALVLSSTDINRQKIYIQQPPTAASGHSSQAFAPHFPHTVRTKETKDCADCHVSRNNDNNAIMAQLLLFGTNFMNFVGYNAWVGTGEDGIEAVQVTEWDEPQAVIGSYLQRYAYPDWYREHQERGKELPTSYHHSAEGGAVTTVQLRGEYLYTTAGPGGFRVYDVSNIANKGFSERIVTAPFSPLGQNTHVSSKDARSFALPTTMPVAPFRAQLAENLEQPLHPIYHYAAIADYEEGLILVNVDTLQDGEPRNNFLERAITWNEGGVLNGATHIMLAGSDAYVATPKAIVSLDLDIPLKPRVRAIIPFDNPSASAIQFRYLFVTDRVGLHVVDITDRDRPLRVHGADVALKDARNLYLARTYAYVAGGKEGLVIIDIEKPELPRIYQRFTDDGKINDLYDVKVASTNASLFAYLADGSNGLKVLQLTDPERVPGYYGFSPEVKPLTIAWRKTGGPARAISKGLDRDRGVDESGHQVSIFGRIGSRPFNRSEMERLYLNPSGALFTVD